MSLQQEFQESAAPASRQITLEEGITMLFDAVNGGDIPLVKQLVGIGVAVDSRNDCGDTPLILAVHRGKQEAVKELLALKADPNARNNEGLSSLYYATRQGAAMVEALLDAGAICPPAPPPALKALMVEAVFSGYAKVVKAALTAGADANDVIPATHGVRFLHHAGFKGYSEIVRALIDAGADINATDDDKRSVLRAAMEGNNTECVMALLDAGADTHNKSLDLKSGRTITDESFAVNCNFEIAQAALHASKKFNMIEKAAEGDAGYVREMLEGGFSPDTFDRCGRTALIYACANGHAAVARELVSHGAVVNLRSKGGDTPMMVAACNNRADIVHILGDAGASVYEADSSGMTPAKLVEMNLDVIGAAPATKAAVYHFRGIEIEKMAENAICLDTGMAPMKALRLKPRVPA